MLGYIIATDKNDVVFLDGDEVFKLHLHDMIQKEMHMSEDDSASTSSGIFTDSENGESSKTDSIRARKKSGQVQFNPAEISHVFLPLLSFHRASAESSHDTVEVIESSTGTIQYKKLHNDYIILCFSEQENKRKELMNNVELTLETNFGPLMSLCASDLTSVRSGRENMRLIYDLMPQRKGKSLLNVKHTSFYKNQLHEVAPLIQIVSTQLKSAVGTNRCLLLSSGNVLASMSSSAERKGLVDGLSIKDLLFSLDQLPKLPEGLDTATVSQFWLRSKDGVIPHYVNALQYRLTSKLDLLCISETKHNELIRYFSLFLKQLEQVTESFRITKDLKEISRTVSDLQSMIVREKSYGGAVPAAFMKNPTRLSSFIQTIWEQIEFELKRKSNELWQNNNGMSRLSLGSLRSVISNLSMTSSAFSKSTHRNKVCSTKADVLIAYARRQVVTIIHELCAISIHEANSSTLNSFQKNVSSIFRGNRRVHLGALAIGDESLEKSLEKHLSPQNLHMDMIAYKFVVSQKQTTITHLPDGISIELEKMPVIFSAEEYCCDFKGASGAVYSLYHIRVPSALKHQKKGLRRLWSLPENLHEPKNDLLLTAVFPHYVHQQLAMRQVKKLHEILSNIASQVSIFYQ